MKSTRASNRLFARFNSLTPDFLNCDMHIHTLATDGRASIRELIIRAEEIGLDRIAFTEHVRADSVWFHGFADEVRNLGRKTKVKVFVGAEARILDTNGNLDISESIRQECDIVLASVHRFPNASGGYLAFAEIPAAEFARIEYDLALGFLKYGQGEVLAHPGGMSVKLGNGFPSEMLRQLMQEAAARGIAIELNSSYIADMRDFCSLAAEENPLVSIGSDVHHLADLGRCRSILKEEL